MQETRQQILEILRDQGEATVEDLVSALRRRRSDTITAVTVRHHLNELLREQLITTPESRHRSSPGRPQYVYALTESAQQHFPNNYHTLASHIFAEIRDRMSPHETNVILEGVADRMADQAAIPNVPLQDRVELAVQYLNRHGYEAQWEKHDNGFILSTTNCPYHHLREPQDGLCNMDMRLVARLIGVVPRLQSRVSDGDQACTYFIPNGN